MANETLVFKIWNWNRSVKKCICFLNTEIPVYETLIAKAFKKFNINNKEKVSLVLETDGTEIDDDDSLLSFKDQVLLLLKEEESWEPESNTKDQSFLSLASTVTIDSRSSSPACSSNSSLISENTWIEFPIPTEKFPSTAQRDLKDGVRNQQTIKEIVHIVASEMMAVAENIPTKACKIVANKLITKFPKTFKDFDDDDVTIGDGSITIYNQLREHIKYVKSKKRSNNSPVPPVNKRKKLSQCRAGCSTDNWQPTVIETEDISESLKSVDCFDEHTKALMERAFAQQREFLNKIDPPPPSLENIRQTWPILLSYEGILYHFEKLMNFEARKLTDSLLEKATKFFTLGLKKKIILEIPTNTDEKIFAVLKVITNYFGENLSSLICNINEESEIVKFTDTNAPRIVCLIRNDTKIYLIVMEKQPINDIGVQTLEEALQQMFAIYYILNLEYPKSISNTLELMQMYFLKIHPHQGSRNKKKSKSKIASLLNKLRDF